MSSGISEFWYRGHRIAFFKADGSFDFDCDNKAGLPNCQMPHWTTTDLKIMADWLIACALNYEQGLKLPESVLLD